MPASLQHQADTGFDADKTAKIEPPARSPLQHIASRRERAVWKDWNVGSFAYAWLPERTQQNARHERTWRKHPVLVVKIIKDGFEDAQFIVAPLQDRRAVVRQTNRLAQPARWMALASLLLWPRNCTFVLHDRYDIVYEWELSTWRRKVPPSLTMHWVVSTRTGRLKRWHREAGDELGAALNATTSFRFLLQLPRELRDMIYSYALFDEHQMTTHSRIYVRAFPTEHKRVADRSVELDEPTVVTREALPMFHTPAIVRVSKQIRREALEVMYRTKVLVVTVDCASPRPTITKTWSPRVALFTRIRFDIVMHQICADEIYTSFQQISVMLSDLAHALRFLEIRIGYLRAGASAAITDYGCALVLNQSDVERGMRELRVGTKLHAGQSELGQHRLVRIGWGVAETQKHSSDYDCNCVYLAADFLDQTWRKVLENGDVDSNTVLEVQEEGCRAFGCSFHGC